MRAKLLPEVALGLRRAREDYQTARFLIQPMDRAHAAGLALACLCQQIGQQVRQRRRQEPATPLSELRRLLRMAHRGKARRLIHHDQVLVRKANDRSADLLWRCRLVCFANLHALAGLDPPGRIAAYRAVEANLQGLHESARL